MVPEPEPCAGNPESRCDEANAGIRPEGRATKTHRRVDRTVFEDFEEMVGPVGCIPTGLTSYSEVKFLILVNRRQRADLPVAVSRRRRVRRIRTLNINERL